MSAGTDLVNAANGVDAQGNALPWRWVYVRARTLLGFTGKKKPYMRGATPATPALYDAITGTAEQIATRYIASDGNVWDFHDWLRVQIELMIAATPADKLAAARAAAGTLRPWPANYPGTPDTEIGK